MENEVRSISVSSALPVGRRRTLQDCLSLICIAACFMIGGACGVCVCLMGKISLVCV